MLSIRNIGRLLSPLNYARKQITSVYLKESGGIIGPLFRPLKVYEWLGYIDNDEYTIRLYGAMCCPYIGLYTWVEVWREEEEEP